MNIPDACTFICEDARQGFLGTPVVETQGKVPAIELELVSVLLVLNVRFLI